MIVRYRPETRPAPRKDDLVLPHPEYLALRRFPALDGLRAVAAAMVVFFHYGQPTWDRLTGWIGVHVFFVLSGFLITTLMLREETRDDRVSLWRFYVRRAARILPVYYVVLALVAALYLLRSDYTRSGLATDMPHYLTFMGELLGPGQPHGQVWTLGIEQKFYLVWPLLAFAVVVPDGIRAGLAVLLGAAALVAWQLAGWAMLVHYAVLAMGCVLAVVAHHARGWSLIRPLTHPAAAAAVAAGFLVLQWFLPDLLAAFGGEPPVILLYGAAVTVLLGSILGGRGPAARVLALRPLAAAGDRSYSLYLIQGVAGMVVAATLPALAGHPTLTAVAVLAVALIMADVLYRWIELPGIALGRRLTRRRDGVVEITSPVVARAA
jgi:peptidoglycan/LPS O-acetylase OafA/YrhL